MTEFVFDQSERVGLWVSQQLGPATGFEATTKTWGQFYAMGVERDGVLIAGVVVNGYNGVNATAHLALLKTGKYLPDLIRFVCDYCFRRCALKRFTVLVAASNKRSLALVLHIGFVEEFVMQKAAHDGGAEHVLVMWAETCPWLKRE